MSVAFWASAGLEIPVLQTHCRMDIEAVMKKVSAETQQGMVDAGQVVLKSV